MLVESVLLAAIGGSSGVLIALAGARTLNAWLPRDFYRVGDVQVDPFSLAAAAAIAMGTGILFGLAPAWMVSHLDVNNKSHAVPLNATAYETLTRLYASRDTDLDSPYVFCQPAGH